MPFTLSPAKLRIEIRRPLTRMTSAGAVGLPPDGIFHLPAGIPLDLDFGREYVGSLHFVKQGNGKLHLRYGEIPEELSCCPENAACPWYELPRDTVTENGTIVIRRRAFRYLRLFSENGEADLRNLEFRTEEWPLEMRGRFHCSNPRLEQIWELCRHTIRLCTQDYLEDGVKRDTLLWIGDARVEAQCLYALSGDCEPVRRSLLLMANSQRSDGMIPACCSCGGGNRGADAPYMFPGEAKAPETELTTYCADFLSMLKEYYLYSGDRKSAEELFDTALRQARYLVRSGWWEPFAGVLLAPEAKFWNPPEDVINDAASALAAVLCGLKDFLKTAGMLGQASSVSDIAGRTELLAAILRSRYLDSSNHLLRMPPPEEPVNFTGQSFALSGGLISRREAAAGFAALLAGKQPAAFPSDGMSRYRMLKGLFEAGLGDAALHEIEQCWGFMLDHGASTAWEKINLYKPDRFLRHLRGSRCHGWSAGPSALFSRFLLGVRIEEPGCGFLRISPDLYGLDWMDGIFPTPYGDISITADPRNIRIQAPRGVRIEVPGRQSPRQKIFRS